MAAALGLESQLRIPIDVQWRQNRFSLLLLLDPTLGSEARKQAVTLWNLVDEKGQERVALDLKVVPGGVCLFRLRGSSLKEVRDASVSTLSLPPMLQISYSEEASVGQLKVDVDGELLVVHAEDLADGRQSLPGGDLAERVSAIYQAH